MIAVGPTFVTEPQPKPNFRPRGPLLHVRFLPVASTWASGIHLPETMQTNTTEAEVIGRGPGRRYAIHPYDDDDQPDPEYWRSEPWPLVGDTVCFEEHMCRRVGPNEIGLGEDEGFVDCEAVLGLVDAEGGLRPLSDWVMLKPEARPDETTGGVRLGDRVQRWRQKGTVLEFGPGYLYVDGPCAVKRKTVPEIVNLSTFRAGLVVYWKRDARILQIGRDVVEAWLVRAGDLLCWE